jgi:hypothetical protein
MTPWKKGIKRSEVLSINLLLFKWAFAAGDGMKNQKGTSIDPLVFMSGPRVKS